MYRGVDHVYVMQLTWNLLPGLLRQQNYPSREGLAGQGWVAFGGAYCCHREYKKLITPSHYPSAPPLRLP